MTQESSCRPSRTARSGGDDARISLLDAAERLFAQRGIEGPSLREINLAAGQRNKSSLQYHFKSREGLLRAILERHNHTLQQRRAEPFERLIADDAWGDIVRIAEVILRPYADFLRDSAREFAYLIICAELLGDPRRPLEELQYLYQDPLIPRIPVLVLSLLDIPEALARERVIVATWQAIDAIAGRARVQLHGGTPRALVPVDLFISNLIDMFVAAVTAPIGEKTRVALETR